MSQFKKSKLAKVMAGVVGIASGIFMLGLVGLAVPSTAYAQLSESQIQSILTLLSSFGADSATVANVDAALRGQATPGTGTPGTGTCTYTFTQNLDLGDRGEEARQVQIFLNTMADTRVAASGAGSPGNETAYYGSLTKAAVVKFQNKYAADVLHPLGLSSGTGYWGPSSRAKANALCQSTTPPPGTTPPPASGAALSVSAASQPAASLAPQSATRIPFTRFTLTTGSNSVTVNSVVVERVGLGQNATFSGVILLDQNGNQLGLAKTLNSNNQATVGESVTIPAGQSRTFTVAGNMAASLGSYAGQVVGLSVVGINTSATVSGSLPVSGAQHTINSTLSIGTVTAARGNLDPNTNSTEEIGTVGKRFASIRLTAGSTEKVRVRNIRWNQAGSASSDDLANVVVEVDGTTYGTVVSSDGKYYNANLGSGIVLDKGASKDFTVKGDIVSGADRTVVFDIYKDTDVYVTGETYGYGITASPSSTATGVTTSSQFTTGTPWYDASHITVGSGSLVVSSSNAVPGGNVANGANDASLGAFTFNVTGEAVTWSQIAFTIATTGSGSDEAITNMTLVDGNGNVISGPQDPNSAGDTVTFSDSVTLPSGENTLIVKGNLDNDWEANDTIIIKLDPDGQITSLTGADSGSTLTPAPTVQLSAKTQTVQAGTLIVVPAASLASNTIIDGSTDVVLGRFSLDTTSSGEDVKVTVAQVRAVTGTNADLDELSNLQLFDGSTALTTGSNVVNPSGNDGGADANLTFTLDGTGLVIPKGSSKIIELRGSVNASSTPTGDTTYRFDHSAGSPDWTVTGVSTGAAITETLNSGAGATVTVSDTGTLTATVASSDPTEKWYKEGERATIGVFNFAAGNEDMQLTDLGLELDTASAAAADFASISLWDGATKIDEKLSPAFTNNEELFSFGLGSFVVSKNDDKDLTVKATFAPVGTGQPGTSGHLVKLATTTTSSQNKAKGLSSGSSVDVLGSAGTTTGARYFNALPKVAHVPLGSTVLANGTRDLYKFSVEATGNDVSLYKFSFDVSTTGTTATAFKVVDDLGRTVKSGQAIEGTVVNIVVASANYGADQITLSAGEKRTYTLQATVTGASTGDSIVTQLEGDAAYDALASTFADTASNVDSDANDDFIWSDRNASSHSLTTSDWFNGYKVPGLPTSNLDQAVLSL